MNDERVINIINSPKSLGKNQRDWKSRKIPYHPEYRIAKIGQNI